MGSGVIGRPFVHFFFLSSFLSFFLPGVGVYLRCCSFVGFAFPPFRMRSRRRRCSRPWTSWSRKGRAPPPSCWSPIGKLTRDDSSPVIFESPPILPLDTYVRITCICMSLPIYLLPTCLCHGCVELIHAPEKPCFKLSPKCCTDCEVWRTYGSWPARCLFFCTYCCVRMERAPPPPGVGYRRFFMRVHSSAATTRRGEPRLASAN